MKFDIRYYFLLFLLLPLTRAGLSAQNESYTWTDHVACIVYNNCSNCHNDNGIAPFSLTTYEEVYDARFQIVEAISTGAMPPWMPDPHFQRFEKERFLDDAYVKLVSDWVEQGAPSGDLERAPEPPEFSGGPEILNPDLSMQIPNYEVPDLPDIDLYRCFVFDHQLDQDRFIKEVEIIPSDASLVHHVIIFQDTTGVPDSLDRLDSDPGYTCFGGIGTDNAQMVGGWAPGVGTIRMPEGFGVKIARNARLVVQLHYPEGNQGKIDDTQINIRFTDPTEEVRDILILPVLNHYFAMTNGPLEIKAGEIKTFYQQLTFPFQATLTGIAPHAHLVCESMKAYAVTPTGDTINLIDIPHWDFEWQGYYQFQKPIVLPGWSTLHGVATYNNTEVNHHLPYDIPRDVFVGEATSDEMMVFFFGISGYVPGDEDLVIDTTSRVAGVNACQAGVATSSNDFLRHTFTIKPNPGSDWLQVDLRSNYESGDELVIMSMDGTVHRLLQLSSARETLSLDLPSGLYLVGIKRPSVGLSQPRKLAIMR